jgi:hypothetical protein
VIHVAVSLESVGRGTVLVDMSLVVKTLSFVVMGFAGDSDRLKRSLSSTRTFQKPLKSKPVIPRPIDCCADGVELCAFDDFGRDKCCDTLVAA